MNTTKFKIKFSYQKIFFTKTCTPINYYITLALKQFFTKIFDTKVISGLLMKNENKISIFSNTYNIEDSL
jgi:hypothetical protein